jgi:hypothetical protein
MAPRNAAALFRALQNESVQNGIGADSVRRAVIGGRALPGVEVVCERTAHAVDFNAGDDGILGAVCRLILPCGEAVDVEKLQRVAEFVAGGAAVPTVDERFAIACRGAHDGLAEPCPRVLSGNFAGARPAPFGPCSDNRSAGAGVRVAWRVVDQRDEARRCFSDQIRFDQV